MSQANLQSIAAAICAERDFDLVGRVGAGAFKETFEARMSDGTPQALKVFQQANSPQRTEREIEAMVLCDHPNIGKLSSIDTFRAGEKDYLFSLEEYFSGGTLTQRINNGQLSVDEVKTLGELLISAVAHIASHGLVHRDLKPDNIMFREDGTTPVIVDFGLVRDLSNISLTQTWVAMGPGTPYYAAPEQLTNDKEFIDKRTDQFALGVLLTECAFGYHPYSEEGDAPGQVVERVAQRSGPAQRFETDAVASSLPALMRMVAPWPVGRFRTSEHLAKAWREQGGGELVPAYHQMGYHSANLLEDPQLNSFQGAILSPVNYTEAEMSSQTARFRGDLDLIFDPQLYFPRSERGKLRDWRYFPEDVETADPSSSEWWQRIVDGVVSVCGAIRPDAACSPAMVPRAYTNEYYAQMVGVGSSVAGALEGTGVRAIQTAIVSLADLSVPGRSLEVASILSSSAADTIYLIFFGDTDPRRELSDPEEIKGAMRLVSSLEGADLSVLVGFTSSDIVLWKAAGASSCATGKFFNLRRFTSSRFEEPSQGGGQLPYWFEESLLAFLRESDLIRLQRANLLGATSLSNPFGSRITEQLDSSPETPWVGLGWRQFMYAFADLEGRLSSGSTDTADLLARAERAWLDLEDATILMEEPRNDGTWLRPWRRALIEYRNH